MTLLRVCDGGGERRERARERGRGGEREGEGEAGAWIHTSVFV